METDTTERMTGRRAFLKTTGSGLLAWRNPANAAEARVEVLRNARAVVAAGQLGQVWVCRIPGADHIGDVEFVLGTHPPPVFDVDASAEQTVLLGSDATLAIGRDSVTLFSGEQQKPRGSRIHS